MRSLWMLTLANYRSFVRDRAALFWTLAFPVIFVVLFGTIFSGSEAPEYRIGWVDRDGTPAATQLRDAVTATTILVPTDVTDDAAAEAAMRDGDLDGIVVVPSGLGEAFAAGSAGGEVEPIALLVTTDPSRQTASAAIGQTLAGVAGAVNLQLSGGRPVLVVEGRAIQADELNGASYFVPSILAMALMQLGVFAAIPLVALREKLVLKRLAATPLSRGTLVGGNVTVRLLIAAVQTVIIVGLGVLAFQVVIVGGPLAVAFLVVLGAVTFIALGYVIASFTKTEEAANGVTQFVQLPMMFLSGIFFPLELLPEWLRGLALLMPLTYLGDALRQVMVGGVPFMPLPVDVAVLAGWLVGCVAISARYFRWQ
ncbi:MAG TPA: ABC transporter permease [Candidatus Limnocylindrales bacterium]